MCNIGTSGPGERNATRSATHGALRDARESRDERPEPLTRSDEIATRRSGSSGALTVGGSPPGAVAYLTVMFCRIPSL